MQQEFLMGNEAIAMGAIAAGVNLVAGYRERRDALCAGLREIGREAVRAIDESGPLNKNGSVS